MSRAKTFIDSLNEERILVQYTKSGNSSTPVSKTHEILDPGVYNISVNMNGQAVYTKTDVKSDVLLDMKNEKRQSILSEFKTFWSPETKAKYDNLGFIHKRGFIWEGKPGTGKSCDMKLFMRYLESQGDIAFLADSGYTLVEVLKQFKEVEPDRHVAVVMEDFEEMANRSEHSLLELLDGPNAIGGVFYLATTNHINQISPRLKRKSRFDTIIHVDNPEYTDRLEYLKSKLSTNESDINIEKLAQDSDGASFADLKDMLVNIYCFGKSIESTLTEMRNQGLVKTGSQFPEDKFNIKMKESFNIVKKYKLNESDSYGLEFPQAMDQVIKLINNVWGIKPVLIVKDLPDSNMTENTEKEHIKEKIDALENLIKEEEDKENPNDDHIDAWRKEQRELRNQLKNMSPIESYIKENNIEDQIAELEKEKLKYSNVPVPSDHKGPLPPGTKPYAPWKIASIQHKINMLKQQPIESYNMSRAARFLEQVDKIPLDVSKSEAPTTPSGNMPMDKTGYPDGPVSPDYLKKSMNQRFQLLNISGVSVDNVDSDENGSVFFTFSDEEGNTMDVAFTHSEADKTKKDTATVEDSEFDLGKLAPTLVTTPWGKYMNFMENSWLDKETLLAIFKSGGLSLPHGVKAKLGKDAFGNRVAVKNGS
jgi:hypothetical protein